MLNNRCNLRSLSIFQTTDKHIADDCSQTQAPLRNFKKIAKTSRLGEIAALENTRRERTPFTNDSAPRGRRSDSSVTRLRAENR